ncbi:hypothetical protein BDP27DRAFT_1418111 [Rhodocollybia butyracea]|uniref:Uncharacterized protein n=1 Tax=Rhodocollybia butyracea TaxID=206335 RepID=A0A9P5Q1V2_9AGAR|nr:hypothetical protein BDP27DRAFT_1418111 [Rhodocollybia butyracea]
MCTPVTRDRTHHGERMAEHNLGAFTVYSYENEARIAALAKVDADVTGAMQDGDGGSLADVAGPSMIQDAPANVAAELQRMLLDIYPGLLNRGCGQTHIYK